MPVARKKRDKKRVFEKNPFNFESTIVPTPEEIVPKAQQKPKGNFDAKKPLNKNFVSNENFHRTSKK